MGWGIEIDRRRERFERQRERDVLSAGGGWVCSSPAHKASSDKPHAIRAYSLVPKNIRKHTQARTCT